MALAHSTHRVGSSDDLGDDLRLTNSAQVRRADALVLFRWLKESLGSLSCMEFQVVTPVLQVKLGSGFRVQAVVHH